MLSVAVYLTGKLPTVVVGAHNDWVDGAHIDRTLDQDIKADLHRSVVEQPHGIGLEADFEGVPDLRRRIPSTARCGY